MALWNAEELRRIGGADELSIASRRDDGTIGPAVTIWTVRVGDELYVRSAYGSKNPWYLRAKASGSGWISAGGVERDAVFEEAGPEMQDAVDAAYHAKYDRYGPTIVGSVVGEHAHGVTIRLVPADTP